MADADTPQLKWRELPIQVREDLGGRLTGIWGASSDEEAFDSFSVDKQQALLYGAQAHAVRKPLARS